MPTTVQTPHQLTNGQAAPLFTTQDVHGKTIRLQDFAGKKVLLSFFRYSSCALCNLRVHKLIERSTEYRKRGLEILVVFESPLAKVLESVGKQRPPFPIIADPAATLYELYGVQSDSTVPQRAQEQPDIKAHVQAAATLGYELKMEEGANFFREPADFLIDLTGSTNGVIVKAHYTRHIFDHLPFQDIDAFVAKK